jgi:hypothetical protein
MEPASPRGKANKKGQALPPAIELEDNHVIGALNSLLDLQTRQIKLFQDKVDLFPVQGHVSILTDFPGLIEVD